MILTANKCLILIQMQRMAKAKINQAKVSGFSKQTQLLLHVSTALGHNGN